MNVSTVDTFPATTGLASAGAAMRGSRRAWSSRTVHRADRIRDQHGWLMVRQHQRLTRLDTNRIEDGRVRGPAVRLQQTCARLSAIHGR